MVLVQRLSVCTCVCVWSRMVVVAEGPRVCVCACPAMRVRKSLLQHDCVCVRALARFFRLYVILMRARTLRVYVCTLVHICVVVVAMGKSKPRREGGGACGCSAVHMLSLSRSLAVLRAAAPHAESKEYIFSQSGLCVTLDAIHPVGTRRRRRRCSRRDANDCDACAQPCSLLSPSLCFFSSLSHFLSLFVCSPAMLLIFLL